MKYEATINFEVKGEDIDIIGLIEAAEKIDLSGVELIGRADDGEVAEQMTMGWAGAVDWTDEAKVRIAEATKEIARRLDVDEESANRLWEGMADVYEAMASKGLSAYPGGEQSVRVIPEALEFIRRRADEVPNEN
jgi:phytoene/squalene synthetase